MCETCPEAGSKRALALPSDKPGALASENGFPLNDVRVHAGGAGTSNRPRIGHDLGGRFGAAAACRLPSAAQEGGLQEKGARPLPPRTFQGHLRFCSGKVWSRLRFLDRLHCGWQMDSWLGQFGTRHHDDNARHLLREERITPRGEQAFRRWEHMGRVGFDPRSFLFSSYVRRTFPSKETRRILATDVPGPPVVPITRGSGDRFGIPNLRESVWALLCVAERRATRPNGEWGYSTRHHMLGPERPEAVSPRRGVVLTDLHSSIDCQ